MTTFDVILITDTATFPHWSRGYGAHRIASHLRLHGFSVLVIDFSSALTFDVWQQLCDLAIGDNTQMVGFSTTWWPYRDSSSNNSNFRLSNIDWLAKKGEPPAIDTESLTYHAVRGTVKPWIDLIKEKNKKIKIVLGGPKIDFYLDFPADYFISGLGENQIIDLITDKRRIWPKILQHDINSNSREWGWKTSTTLYTKYDQIKSMEILNLEIARGCKFKCNFCSFPLIGQKDVASYLKTEEVIYNEIMTNYNQWGVTKYFVADDTYNDSVEKLEMMVRIKQRLPFDLKIKAYIRADVIVTQPEQIKLLHDGGLASCYIGIESFHPEASKFAGKGMKPEKRKQALYDMQSAWGDDVSINVGYIVGLPGEDTNFLKEQADWFSQKDCPVNYGVSFIGLVIHPYKPGSTIHPSAIDKDPESFGYNLPDDSKPGHWIKNDGTDITHYLQASDLADELNAQVWSLRGSQIDNVDYKAGDVKNPKVDYFIPLIEMLRND